MIHGAHNVKSSCLLTVHLQAVFHTCVRTFVIHLHLRRLTNCRQEIEILGKFRTVAMLLLYNLHNIT